MDPLCPPGWNLEQKQFAHWSDSDSSKSSEEECQEEEEEPKYKYFRITQVKKTYKVILEEEDLIE
jgi:hypothetical protein